MAVWSGGRSAEIISIRGQVRGSIYEGFDFAAAATVVDIGRHQPKLISATRPRRHVAFLNKPE